MNRLLHLLAALPLLYVQGTVAQPPNVAEQYLLAAINQERAAHALAPVRLDPALQQAALDHAQRMVSQHTISHQFSGEPELPARAAQAGAHFARITENVAEGPNTVSIHKGLMRSAGHRANILDPAVDAIGLAVLTRKGQLYAVQDFQATVTTLSFEQQEAAVAVLLDAAGLELIPGSDARQTCAMPSGYAGHTQPSFIIHFTTNNLSRLPSKLQARLASHQNDRRAAVGACAPRTPSDFTQYNVAVMLYP